jgi:hypothetical protein
LLSRYFAVARTVIGRYGGAVEKFIGDAVMAVWGTPVAEEGDAERAVRAALDLVAAVAEMGEEAGAPGLVARAGVVTGEVAVTLGAVGEGMVAGDAVNTAARVQAAADPGSVLADTATQRLAGNGIGFAEAGSQRLKGKAEPERLWRAIRVLSAVGGLQRVDGLARAYLVSRGDDQAAAAAFASAITSLREMSTPYHLAHGLLDHAEHLIRLGEADTATLAIGEARDIARRLDCQPLLDRAAKLTPTAQCRVQQ